MAALLPTDLLGLAAVWIAGVGAAMVLKLSSSIDDVVWLAPFLTSNSSKAAKLHNSAIYIGVCLTQTFVAMALAYSGDSLVGLLTHNAKNAWTSQKILTVGAGTLLAAYSVKLAYEYFTEGEGDGDCEGSEDKYTKIRDEDAGREEDEGKSMPPSLMKSISGVSLESLEDGGRPLPLDIDGAKDELGQTQRLFVIAFLGSLDDLTLFVPMLVGKSFDLAQLVLGSFAAAFVIVCLCLFLGLCKPIADCLSRIPLAAIVASFAVFLLFKGFLSTE